MASYEQDAETRRTRQAQIALAKQIGPKLIPIGPHSSFSVANIGSEFYVKPLCTIAWWAVATQIECAADKTRIIDHAWLAGYDDATCEPWALISEPYIDAEHARAIAHQANDAMAEWSVRIRVFEPAQSSWNPGSCTPIVATFDDVRPFMRGAVQWALEHLPPTADYTGFIL